MSSFSEFKKLIVKNDFNTLNVLIENISQKELAIILSNVLMSFYTDINFYNKVKVYFLAKSAELKYFYKVYFDVFYLLEEATCEKNIIYLLNSNIEPILFFKLLSGGLRNKCKLIKKICNENEIHHSYKEVLTYYFLSKRIPFKDIADVLDEQNVMVKDKYTKKKLRVALLVSGQIRGLEPSLKSWVDTLGLNNDDIEIDIFISTWGKSGIPKKHDFSRVGSDLIKLKIDEIRKKHSDDYVQDLLDPYSPPINITDIYLKDQIGKFIKYNNIDVNIEDDNLFSEYTNPMKLYYKIHDCFEMSKKNGHYDLYIRIRPDLVLTDIKIDLISVYNELSVNSKIYCGYGYSYEYYGFGVDDKFAIAKYDHMQTYSNTWLYDHGSNTRMIGHTNLANNLFYHKIDIDRFDNMKTFFSNYNVMADSL